MAQRPRPLDPALSPEAFFGARVRDLRTRNGWSQAELGRRVHASGALIAKIEKAERRPAADLVSRLDDTLGAGGDLTRAAAQLARLAHVLPAASRTAGQRLNGVSQEWVLGLDRLRKLADLYDCPEDGPTRSLPQLNTCVSDVVRMRVASDYSGLLVTLPRLIPEITRAMLGGEGPERQGVAGLLTQVWRAADAIADKSGQFDLSARLIHIMGWAAARSGEELLNAATQYVRAETFFASGQLGAGREVLERAADRLTPGICDGAIAQYGALHMRAAVVAAGAGQPGRAADHLAEARAAACHVREGIWHGTVFGPVSVRIHEVSAAVELRDPQTALSAAAGWVPPATVPAERRSHFYVDLARALLAVGRGEAVLEALDRARVIAPEHVRMHPVVRQALVEVASFGAAHADSARRFTGILTRR